VERPEIIEILIESLGCPESGERRVAYEFLREIVTRPGEPLTNRSRAATHLALYQARCIGDRCVGILTPLRTAKAAFPADRLLPKARSAARSARHLVSGRYRSPKAALLFAYIITANGYFRARDGLASCAARLARGIAAALAAVIDIVAGALSAAYALRSRAREALVAAYTSACSTVKSTYTSIGNRIKSVYTSVCGLAGSANTAVRNTTESAYVRTIGALVAIIAAARNGIETAYSETVRFTVRTVVRFRDAVLLRKRRIADRITLARADASRRYVRARIAVLTVVARIVDRVVIVYRRVRYVYAEIKRHAVRQVLPQPATPFIAAGLVCLVLFVFGINSYFVISGVNRKGIFMDLSRYEWGDEALASILIGEGYDIYLNEKITEKRIKELLASGHYYERVIRVTGYYSPLPDQEKYATGSYRGDIILNGRGVLGADTTPVYVGMAAGPAYMEYGTNVIIEDLGEFNLPKIYTIHDRGGAIKGNRLDIWVGKGEEAMRKAYDITGYYKVIVVGDK
jgi:3D (Asp-Asp-Asp) domain-containing protein